MPYASVGLLYCGIDTTQPGTYTVKFTVANDYGISVSVQRTVVVQPSCSSGEQACSDGTCGEWGPLGARSVCVCGTSWPVVTGCAVSGGGWMLGAGRDGAGCVRHLLHQRGG